MQFRQKPRRYHRSRRLWNNHVCTILLLVDSQILIRSYSNNVLAGSLGSLNIDDDASKTLLSNPQTYLDTVSDKEADRIRNVLIPAYRKGFRIIFITGAALCALAFVIAFFMLPQVELSRPDDEKLREEGRKAYEDKKRKDIA